MKIIIWRIWDHFGDKQWDKLIESMLERMEVVIVVRDGFIRF